MNFKAMFEPIKIGQMEVKNRLVMPPMGTNSAEDDCSVGERMTTYYGARAKGGFGLITIEVTAVSPEGRAIVRQPGLWSDDQIKGYSKLADAIHAHGGKMSVQLHHAGRQTFPETIGGGEVVSCSPIPCPFCQVVPRELTTEETYQMIDKFIEAAVRAQKAGADAVEIHGAHGYLIAQYMSSYSNKRIDEFGGSFENRMRFPRMIVEGIRRELGNGFPIIFRISADEMVAGGRKSLESTAVARKMEEAGVNAIHVSGGVYGSFGSVIAAGDTEPGYMQNLAADMKKAVNVPIISVGRINDPHFAESLIASGKADMVAIGRGSIADPDFPNKALTGKTDEINPCIGCLQGCLEEMLAGNVVTCVVNPFTGHQHEWFIEPAKEQKNVMIVGGGPGGLHAAWLLAKRGHNVTLYEKDEKLGGQYLVAAYPPAKGELTKLIRYHIDQCERHGVKIILNMEVDKELIEDKKPDAIVLATGGTPMMLDIKGIENEAFVDANDVLMGRATTGQKVLVAGGGMVGSETADFLGQYGRDVTLVEMRDEIAADVNLVVRMSLMERLASWGTQMITDMTIKEFLSDGVLCTCEGKEQRLDGFDTVVLALGAESYNPLEKVAKELVAEVHVIGDAKEAGKILRVSKEAVEVGISI